MAKKAAKADRRSPRPTRSLQIAQLVAKALGVDVNELEQVTLTRQYDVISEGDACVMEYKPWVVNVSFSRR